MNEESSFHPPDAHEQRMLAVLRSPVLRSLPAQTQQAVAAHLSAISLSPGQIVYCQGMPADALYLVAEGTVRLTREHPSGPPSLLATLHPGDIVGDAGLLDAAPRPATCRAEGAAVLWRLDRSAFLTLIQEDPRVYLALSYLPLRGVCEATDSAAQDYGAALERTQRIIRRLVLAGSAGDSPRARQLRITLDELASLVGSTPDLVAQVLAHLEQAGVVVRRARASIWLDPDRLLAAGQRPAGWIVRQRGGATTLS